MAFHLKYDEGGKVRRQRFNSYYECIKQKEELRKKGIDVEYKADGADSVKTNQNRIRIGKNSRESIKNFLKMCDEIGDFRNFKSV